MMANALLLHCMSPNFLLIAQKKGNGNFLVVALSIHQMYLCFSSLSLPEKHTYRTSVQAFYYNTFCY